MISLNKRNDCNIKILLSEFNLKNMFYSIIGDEEITNVKILINKN